MPRALVFDGARGVALRDVALRPLADGEVAVATRYSAISAGTEKMLWSGHLPRIPGLAYPLVPGYEAAGVVTAAGAGVRGVAVGDEVFVGGAMCYADVAAAFGGQCAVLHKPAERVVPLHGIPLEHAPLLALAATSLHGVRRAGSLAGRRVLVIGMGAIGQFAARFAHAAGAEVFERDLEPSRLGRIPGVAPGDDVRDIDVLVECSGRSAMLAECAPVLRVNAAIVLLGFYERLDVSYPELFVREPAIYVAKEWAHEDLLDARDAIADGRVRVDDLAGAARFPVERFDAAYDAAFGDPSVLKVVLSWA